MSTSYILREIPDELWRQAKSEAALEGVSMKTMILRLLEKHLARAATKKKTAA